MTTMSKPTTRVEIDQHRIARSRESFAQHEITKRSEGRWLLQTRHPDGKPNWIMAAEIVCLEGGRLYVGGDIHPVLFGINGAAPEARVRWLGGTTDVDYYVAQKAAIGMSADVWVREYDYDAARSDIDGLIAYFREYREDCAEDDPMLVALRDAKHRVEDGEHAVLEHLREEARRNRCEGFMEDRYDIGQVVSWRVYGAWAALERLCKLLDAERQSQGSAA